MVFRNRAGITLMGLGVMATAMLVGTAGQAKGQQSLSTAFIYQGQLAAAGAPATGAFDIRFRLYDAASGGNQIGGTLCSDDLAVLAGQFAASLDFGGVFAGQKRWLEIEVRVDTGLDCSDASGYTVLSPRQELTAAPQAAFALTASNASNAVSLNGQSSSFYQNAANLTGTLADAQLSSNIARLNSDQTFTGVLNFTNAGNTFTGNGAGLTNLSGSSISAGTLTRSTLSTDVQNGLTTGIADIQARGSAATGNSPISIAISGTYAYVANYIAGALQVFDVTNPATPTLVGSVATGSLPYAVAASGSFVYVVNEGSGTLQIISVSNPAAPAVVSTIAVGPSPRAVAVSGSYAYATGGSGSLVVVNVSNPAAPLIAGSVAYSSSAFSVAVWGSYAYVADALTLRVFNISNPAAPSLTASVSTGNNSGVVGSVAVSGDYAYVVGDSGNPLRVFNISNPLAPVLTGSITAGARPISVAVSGPFAFVGNFGSNTLQAFDITNPAAPILAGSIGTGSAPRCVAVSGSTVYVGNETSRTLQVFTAPARVSLRFPPTQASLAGADGSGLTSLSASNIVSGTLADGLLSTNVVLKNAASTTFTGPITASAFTGSGAGLTGLSASNITSGTLATAQIPNLDASKITTGTLSDARVSGTIPRLNTNNAFTSTQNSFAGRLGVNTPAGALELDVNGRINVASGVIQKDLSAGVVTATTDLGLYSQIAGGWVRFVTNNAQFAWFSDSGAGTTPRMILSPTGNLTVSGTLAKAGGSFKIDHPLDPKNKYLYHSFVESPDMMNVYNGNVTTDNSGYATITLPDYFDALNRDFRYQLTVIDSTTFALVRVNREISDNTFEIASNIPNTKVSWQVTGIRKDAWAEKNRIPNTVDKIGDERGKYLHPEVFGKPANESISSGSPTSR